MIVGLEDRYRTGAGGANVELRQRQVTEHVVALCQCDRLVVRGSQIDRATRDGSPGSCLRDGIVLALNPRDLNRLSMPRR